MSEKLTGLSIPFRIDAASGGLAMQDNHDEKLKENIIHILMTGIGERAMRRGYGGGVEQLVHDPNNDALRAVVQHQIAKALTRNEPGIILQGVNVTQSEGSLTAELSYLVRQTQLPQNLSVPIGLGGI